MAGDNGSIKHPFSMVIFGATGDLARFKLIPALFKLYQQNLLPKQFTLYGFARRDLSRDDFLDLYKHLSGDVAWDEFVSHYHYQPGKFEDISAYDALGEKLRVLDKKADSCNNRLFYLATPPNKYETILKNIRLSQLSDMCGIDNPKHDSSKSSKIILEKPFGNNLEHAQKLDKTLAEQFQESQIFRVDHYLGKEIVQNILAFRFANGIFDPIWNSNYIDHVQVIISEKNGITGRGQFFDGVGNLRDVAQNHLLQLVTAIAMEQPKSFTKESVRDSRAQAMQAIRLIEPDDVQKYVVRGQYASYTNEDAVEKNSKTETYVAMKLFIDTPRFEDVPFYLQAGKKMDQDFVEISLVFKQTCHILFKEYGCPEIGNVLTFRIQPDEGIHMRTIVKKPGSKLALQPVNMHFTYKEAFGRQGTDAYEKILMDILRGDQMLFNRSDELEHSWKLISNILKGWENPSVPLPIYRDNSDGPLEADTLIHEAGREWLSLAISEGKRKRLEYYSG